MTDMTDMTDADEEKKSKARAEWAKFQDVAELLEFIAQLDKIYDQLKISGAVLAMGPSGDSSSKHSLAFKDDIVWGSLSLQDQYTFLAHPAQRTEPHVNALIPLMQDGFGVQVDKGPMMIQGWKHYQFTRQSPFQPVTDATQIMDMSLLPEIVDVGVEAWNNLIGMDQQPEQVDILLRQVQMLSDDDKSLQKATLASKAVYCFDEAIRIEGLLNEDKNIGIANPLELPQILLPGMNNESIYYGMYNGVRKSSAQFGEGHPVTLHAKYVKLGTMLGKRACEYANELVQEQRSVL
ncbi:MAG: hypothetical protein SGBAC_013016 [Bacillariaceae sp.]